MVHHFKNIFDDSINDVIKNFTITHKKGNFRDLYFNQYHKQFVDLNDDIKNVMCDKIKEYLPDVNVELSYTRVNWVGPYTNVNDPYHTDYGYDVIFTYYYGEYDGGEFEWIEDGVTKKIKPESGDCVLVIGNPHHRVLNVTNGDRYAIVTFFKSNLKKTPKLI